MTASESGWLAADPHRCLSNGQALLPRGYFGKQPTASHDAAVLKLKNHKKTELRCKVGFPPMPFLCARLWFLNEIPPPSCGGISQKNRKFLRMKHRLPCRNAPKLEEFGRAGWQLGSSGTAPHGNSSARCPTKNRVDDTSCHLHPCTMF